MNNEQTGDSNSAPVVALASGVTLGVYLPALLIRERLRARGIAVRVEVLEELYSDQARARLLLNKEAFHKRFAVALMGQKLASNVWSVLDTRSMSTLLDRWRSQGVNRFMVFSGFWIPLVDAYARSVPSRRVSMDECHMDASLSVSWEAARRAMSGGFAESICRREVWFFSDNSGRPMHKLPVTIEPPIPYSERECRFVVHGGGWGIGTYLEQMHRIPQHDTKLDVVIHDLQEARFEAPNRNVYMIRPGWNPWMRGEDGRTLFPPMGRIVQGRYLEYDSPGSYHPLFDCIRGAAAIVSKPGGMTMVDSLASATPLLHLEPFGPYERENAALWDALGFGLSFERWLSTGAELAVLDELHANLLNARHRFIDYAAVYGQ